MKRAAVYLISLALAGCASHHKVEHRELRTDTFRAVLAEQFSVCFDDVVILPRDTIRPIIAVRRAEVRKYTAAEVINTTQEQQTSADQTTPDREQSFTRPLLWLLLAALLILYLKK